MHGNLKVSFWGVKSGEFSHCDYPISNVLFLPRKMRSILRTWCIVATVMKRFAVSERVRTGDFPLRHANELDLSQILCASGKAEGSGCR